MYNHTHRYSWEGVGLESSEPLGMRSGTWLDLCNRTCGCKNGYVQDMTGLHGSKILTCSFCGISNRIHPGISRKFNDSISIFLSVPLDCIRRPTRPYKHRSNFFSTRFYETSRILLANFLSVPIHYRPPVRITHGKLNYVD